MTVEEVQARVEEIRQLAFDDEAAHSREDTLHEDVLRAIAQGADNAVQLAQAALATTEIKFARWCA